MAVERHVSKLDEPTTKRFIRDSLQGILNLLSERTLLAMVLRDSE